jgi:hypothetical protein
MAVAQNGDQREIEIYEKDLAKYLQERIKPGLNRGAIPLLSRSIAKEVAHWETFPDGGVDEDEGDDESDLQTDIEGNLRDLASELGDDWILSFSVHGDDAWLTAEKEDGSQRLEAPDASVLVQAVQLLNEGGGRSR